MGRLTELGLSNRQADLIVRSGNTSDFKISLLQKTVDGQNRIVVLTGEGHYKDQKASDLGNDLVNAFTFKGIEGVDMNANLGRRLLSRSMDFLLPILKMFTGKRAGSTIDAAANMDAELQLLGIVSQMLKEGKSVDDIKGITVTINDVQLTGEPLIERVRLLAAKYSTGDNEPANQVEQSVDPHASVPLEADHVPQLPEQIGTWRMALTIPSYIATTAGVVGHLIAPNHISSATMWELSSALILINAWQYIDTIFYKRFGNNQVFRDYVSIKHQMLDGRNNTMTKNIEKAFADNPSAQRILVIVGDGHREGMRDLLINNYGYSPVPLNVVNSTAP